MRNKNLDPSPATEHKLCRLSILRRNFWVSQTFIVSDVINWRNQFLEGAKFHLCKLIVKSIKENTLFLRRKYESYFCYCKDSYHYKIRLLWQWYEIKLMGTNNGIKQKDFWDGGLKRGSK